MICKTALNLSEVVLINMFSNRIASLMGNGILPFIHTKVMYQDFFDNDEIVTYTDHKDLYSKLIKLLTNLMN